MAKRSFKDVTTFQKLLLIQDSIGQAEGLATGATLELNKNQCMYLSNELQEWAKFFQRGDVRTRILGYESTSSKMPDALLQLYSVLKRAENLVQQCCGSKDFTWLQRALTLFAIEDYVLHIIAHIQWWMSILSMLIDIGGPNFSKSSTLERVQHAHQTFEQTLKGSGELQKAAEEDKKHLLDKVTMEMQATNHGKTGSRNCYNDDNILLLQVYALLAGEDEHLSPQLNEYKYDGQNALMGNGAFGVVHKVVWCGYRCALKQYENLKVDDIELKSLKRLHHPHIVRFYRYWKDENCASYKSHILMERMERDLEQHMEHKKGSDKTRPFSVHVAIDIMLQVISAIWYMHNKGIVHRDLKPTNVLVRTSGESIIPELSAKGYVEIKLGDFGIAKEEMLTSYAGSLTRKTGTTLYRAPELACPAYTQRGTRKFPHTMDMWSFGIMCSQLLTGQLPFNGIEITDLQRHVEKGERPSISTDCPDYLRFCMESCWNYEPEKRPRSLDMWRMLRVAQLRSLGLMDENYDFFSFEDHNNNVVSFNQSVSGPQVSLNQSEIQQVEGLQSDNANVHQSEPAFFGRENREKSTFVETGLLGFLRGSLFK